MSAADQVAKFMFEPVLVLLVSRSERVEIANPVLPVEFFSAVILPYSVAVLSGWAALVAAALVPLVRYRRLGGSSVSNSSGWCLCSPWLWSAAWPLRR